MGAEATGAETAGMIIVLAVSAADCSAGASGADASSAAGAAATDSGAVASAAAPTLGITIVRAESAAGSG